MSQLNMEIGPRIHAQLIRTSVLPTDPEAMHGPGARWQRGVSPDLAMSIMLQGSGEPDLMLSSLSTNQFRVDSSVHATFFDTVMYKGWCKCGGFFWADKAGLELRFENGLGCMGANCTVAANPLDCTWWNPGAAVRLLLSQALLDIEEEELDPEWLRDYDGLVQGVLGLVQKHSSVKGQHWPALSLRGDRNLTVGAPTFVPRSHKELRVQAEEGPGGETMSVAEVAGVFQVSKEQVLKALITAAPWDVPKILGDIDDDDA